jgi:hypothetical protein
VEFALVVPLVLIVLVGAVEIALVARAQLEVSHAAREGAREAAASPDPGRAVAVVHAVLGTGARVAVSRDHHVGGRAEVVVTMPHRFAAPLFGGWTVHLEGRASMRVER